LVAERGLDGATLAGIGERAGTSRGLPTHHFGSKNALVERLAQRAQQRVSDAVWAAAERAGSDLNVVSNLDRLRTTVDTYLRLFESPSPMDRALIVMWGATFPTEASVTGLLEADRRAFDGWAGVIEQGQVDGSIRRDIDPRTTAVLLQGLIRGVAASLLIDSELTEMSRVREACQTFVSSALEPR
jgi:AcrR family transcriptional regulator